MSKDRLLRSEKLRQLRPEADAGADAGAGVETGSADCKAAI